MNLYIHISQLSIITGDNPYQSKRDYLLDFWKKNNPEDYFIYVNQLKENNIVQETDKEIIENISKKYKLNTQNELAVNQKINNVKDLGIQKKEMIQNIERVIEDKEEQKKVIQAISNISNTQFGTVQETSVLKLYEEQMGYSIIKDDVYRKKCIFEKKDENGSILYKLYIGGKIDGIEKNSNTIIEIKNRVRNLFYNLRDYEKVQVYGYMYLHNVSRSHLVEALKSKKETKINIIEVDREEEFMNHILSKTIDFCSFYYDFINSKDMKMRLLDGVWPLV